MKRVIKKILLTVFVLSAMALSMQEAKGTTGGIVGHAFYEDFKKGAIIGGACLGVTAIGLGIGALVNSEDGNSLKVDLLWVGTAITGLLSGLLFCVGFAS